MRRARSALQTTNLAPLAKNETHQRKNAKKHAANKKGQQDDDQRRLPERTGKQMQHDGVGVLQRENKEKNKDDESEDPSQHCHDIQ